MSNASQLLAFDRRTCIALGILDQTPVTLGGKIVLVDFMVIEDPLDILSCVYFNHDEEIITIDQLDFLDLSPNPTRD